MPNQINLKLISFNKLCGPLVLGNNRTSISRQSKGTSVYAKYVNFLNLKGNNNQRVFSVGQKSCRYVYINLYWQTEMNTQFQTTEPCSYIINDKIFSQVQYVD